jgi:hypothetical protein
MQTLQSDRALERLINEQTSSTFRDMGGWTVVSRHGRDGTLSLITEIDKIKINT